MTPHTHTAINQSVALQLGERVEKEQDQHRLRKGRQGFDKAPGRSRLAKGSSNRLREAGPTRSIQVDIRVLRQEEPCEKTQLQEEGHPPKRTLDKEWFCPSLLRLYVAVKGGRIALRVIWSRELPSDRPYLYIAFSFNTKENPCLVS